MFLCINMIKNKLFMKQLIRNSALVGWQNIEQARDFNAIVPKRGVNWLTEYIIKLFLKLALFTAC